MAKGFVGKDCELILEGWITKTALACKKLRFLILIGKEREQFWDYLGGKGQYANEKVITLEEECRLPRMMYCSRRNGSLESRLLGINMEKSK